MGVQLLGSRDREVARGACALPRTMFPSDEVALDCSIPISVASGDYVVSVNLVQPGAAQPWAAVGGPVASIRVSVAAS